MRLNSVDVFTFSSANGLSLVSSGRIDNEVVALLEQCHFYVNPRSLEASGKSGLFAGNSQKLERTRMLELRFTSWDGGNHRFLIPTGLTRIGRTAGNDLQIDDLALSSEHCVVEWNGYSATVRDVESSNGTFLDGALIEQAPLNAGQMLNLGTFSIQVVEGDSAADSSGSLRKSEFSAPARLSDGSYSCQTHTRVRASFECEGCAVLFCSDCFGGGDETAFHCPKCGEALRTIDWSGMARTRGEVIKELLPEGVKKVLKYYEKHRDR